MRLTAFDFENQSWMCKNATLHDTLLYSSRLKKLTEDWSMFDGVLHHDTCPQIDGDKIKGAWTFPFIISNCSCCGAEVPESILMLAKLQMLKPDNSEYQRQAMKKLRYASFYSGSHLSRMRRYFDPR